MPAGRAGTGPPNLDRDVTGFEQVEVAHQVPGRLLGKHPSPGKLEQRIALGPDAGEPELAFDVLDLAYLLGLFAGLRLALDPLTVDLHHPRARGGAESGVAMLLGEIMLRLDDGLDGGFSGYDPRPVFLLP